TFLRRPALYSPKRQLRGDLLLVLPAIGRIFERQSGAGCLSAFYFPRRLKPSGCSLSYLSLVAEGGEPMPRMTLAFVTFLAVAYGGLAFWHSGRDASGQTTTTVDLGDFYFCNSSFSAPVCDTNITAGDTVTWQWVGSASHTVTQCDSTFTTCPPVAGFDSGTMTSG